MGIFGAILDKLRGRAQQAQTQPSAIPGSESTIGGVARGPEHAESQVGGGAHMHARAQAGLQAGAQAEVPPAGGQMQARSEAGRQASAQAGVQPAAGTSSPALLQNVDVEAVLAQIASQKADGGGNYRQSIVDLLKLLELDSSLAARKELAEELNVHAGGHGSAEQNVALHKAVMRKLAENGGKVPASLRD